MQSTAGLGLSWHYWPEDNPSRECRPSGEHPQIPAENDSCNGQVRNTATQGKLKYNKVAIQEDLPWNQAQERAQKNLQILKRDSEKYREIILQGCLLAKIKGIELQRR